jgi:hypothetical protein
MTHGRLSGGSLNMTKGPDEGIMGTTLGSTPSPWIALVGAGANRFRQGESQTTVAKCRPSREAGTLAPASRSNQARATSSIIWINSSRSGPEYGSCHRASPSNVCVASYPAFTRSS